MLRMNLLAVLCALLPAVLARPEAGYSYPAAAGAVPVPVVIPQDLPRHTDHLQVEGHRLSRSTCTFTYPTGN
nr:unnamed protein product [Callosobruchus chinensis]